MPALTFCSLFPVPTKVGNRYDMELTSTAIMAKYRNRVLDHVLKTYAHNHAHMLVLDLDLGVSARNRTFRCAVFYDCAYSTMQCARIQVSRQREHCLTLRTVFYTTRSTGEHLAVGCHALSGRGPE